MEIEPEVLPKSPVGPAVRYALKNWTALIRYSEDGDLAIGNNGTERAIRAIAVGRINWVFFGSDNGGKMAALLRSFVAFCQRVSVDSFAEYDTTRAFRDTLSHHLDLHLNDAKYRFSPTATSSKPTQTSN